VKRIYKKLGRFITHNVLHTDDTPHQLALGVAIGIWFALLPLIGIQMILTVAVSAMFRVNKVVGLPFAWITNPFTAVPIYGFALWLGGLILPGGGRSSVREVFGQFTEPKGWSELLSVEFWKEFLAWSMSVGAELWLGSFIMAVVCAVPSYFICRRMIVAFRIRHQRYIACRRERKSRAENRRLRRLAKGAEPSRSAL
jgi:uncharacterized protein (DUF2062 family)